MKSLEKQSEIFKALSEPNRIRIIKMLQEKSLCVCEITEILQLAASTVSKHLSILKNAGFIIDEKDNKWINYSINPNPENPGILSALFSIKLMMEDDETIKQDRLKMKSVDREVLCNV